LESSRGTRLHIELPQFRESHELPAEVLEP